jgi:hypothetical protein
MRDLEAIGLNLDACVLRARIGTHLVLELELRQLKKALVLVGEKSASIVGPAQLVETLVAAAKRANGAGDVALGSDIQKAARDLGRWYRLDEST